MCAKVLSIGNRKTVKPIEKDSWAIRDHEKGLVDQLEDRRLCKAEALGSSPSESIRPWIPRLNTGMTGTYQCTQRCNAVAEG